MTHQAAAAVLRLEIGVPGKERGHFGLNSLGKQAARAIAKHFGKRIAKQFWLNQLGVSKSSPVRDAIQYGLNQWDGLIRFLEDGRVEIDSNSVERSMRPIALNRKNSLFAGHDQGARNWACLASLIETCKLNSINPNAWLTDVLTKLVNRWPAGRIDELLPWAYAASL